MEWRTEAKTRQEMLDYIKSQPEQFLWAAVLDANEADGEKIAPVIVGIFIFPYSHMAHDLCRRENYFIENRLKYKRVTEDNDKVLRKVEP